MKVVAFIDPPQGEVIEKILRHCGLWRGSAPRPPPDVEDLAHDLDGCFGDSQTGSSDQADRPGAAPENGHGFFCSVRNGGRTATNAKAPASRG
jgi:hypothetical protein